MEMEMRNLFQEDFKDQQSPAAAGGRPIQSSSSSSLRSLSMDSPSEYSSLLFNIPTSSHLSETLIDVVPKLQPLTTTSASTSTSIITTAGNTGTNTSLQHAMESFAQLPITQETEQNAMTRAILAVLTSPTSSSSSSQQQQQQQEQPQQPLAPPKASAFKNYNLALAPTSNIRAISAFRGQSILKRTISYYRSLNIARREYTAGPSRPTSTQLHHMISERKRREKLNESFHALRSLLPPGTKVRYVCVCVHLYIYLYIYINRIMR